ncbi:adenylate cyclase [compost metagenome]
MLTLDQVTLNSWNEVQVHRYDGEHALLRCLRDYLNNLGNSSHQPRLRVRCFCHNRAQAIAQRVEDVFITAQALLAENLNYRYLLQVQQHNHVLELQAGAVNLVTLGDQNAVLRYLGEERSDYSPLHLDANALQELDLAQILPMGQPQSIQLFYRVQDASADVYVLDEHNALWLQRLPFHDENSLLMPLQRFLQSIVFRRDARLPLDSLQAQGSLDILYYQLLPSGTGKVRQVEARQAQIKTIDRPYYEVQAILQAGASDDVQVTLYCNQREFSELEHGDQLYAVVARQIIEQRREAERYRCYITDLDLSGVLADGLGSSILYLRYKGELERALNDALAQA